MNKYTAELPVGAAFGPCTVLGPAEPEWRQGHRYVRVECWSCRERRDVSVTNLVMGKCTRCRVCTRGMRRARKGFSRSADMQLMGSPLTVSNAGIDSRFGDHDYDDLGLPLKLWVS